MERLKINMFFGRSQWAIHGDFITDDITVSALHSTNFSLIVLILQYDFCSCVGELQMVFLNVAFLPS